MARWTWRNLRTGALVGAVVGTVVGLVAAQFELPGMIVGTVAAFVTTISLRVIHMSRSERASERR